MKKRILIIGSNGYLGKKLKKDLKYSYNIREFSIKKIKRDIRKKNQVKEFFLKNNDLDIVLNLTGQISNNLKKTNTTNILGTKNIIQYSNKDTLLIFFSSILREKKNLILSKDRRNYIDSKIKMEKLIKKSDRNFNIIRLGNVYDDKLEKKGLLKELKNHFFSNKKINLQNLREINYYIHYKDLINYLVNKSFKNKLNKKIIPLATEKFTNLELFKLFRDNYKNKKKIKTANINRKKLFKTKYTILNTIINLIQ